MIKKFSLRGHEVTDEGLKDLLANLNIQHQLKNLTLILSP